MITPNGRILLVEDELDHASSLMYFLEQDNYTLFHAFTLGEARTILEQESIDIILLDLYLPDGLGTEILRELPLKFTQPPKTIVLSSHKDPQTSALTIKLNAYDYFPKPISIDIVRDKVREALEDRRMETRIHTGELGSGTEGFVVGESPKMQQAMMMVSRFAPLDDITILLNGETGVGKEHFAKMIHDTSPRRNKGKLVIADCTIIPKDLVENELFGSMKGSYTGAPGHTGLVAQAEGGTLFLDEIHHLPLDSQVKLLRLLSAKTYRPLGSNTEKTANVRIVCATNRNLAAEVEAGRFHLDLYQRIKGLTITIPPLRERLMDLDALIAEFISRFNRHYHLDIKGMKPEVRRLFHDYRWVGNVRELKETVRSAMVMAVMDGDCIGIHHLPPELQALAGGTQRPSRLVDKILYQAPKPQDLQHETDRLQESMLRSALARCNGNASQAAKELGITRDQVRYMMKKFGMDADTFKDE
jgi:two-component system response regulator AtoC